MMSDRECERDSGMESRGAGGRAMSRHASREAMSRHASGEAALREAVRHWRSLRAASRCVDGVDVAPRCVHGALVQQALDDLRGDLQEVRQELEWVRRVIIAAIVTAAVETVLRVGGWT